MPRIWSNKETMLLLRLYLKYKQEFHDRQKKRSDIWQHIVQEFEQQGFNATYIMLDRKFRNMSRTYFNIKRQQNGDHNWEYYSAMDEIYSGSSPTTESFSDYEEQPLTEEEPVPAKIRKLEQPDNNPTVLLDEPNFDELMSVAIKEKLNVDATNGQKPLVEALEKQRLNELQAMRLCMQQANEIQRQRNTLLEERNELMRRFLGLNTHRNWHLHNLIN